MMPDREKVIKGLERCLVCSTSVVAPPEAQKAYIDCEYTTYLYCRQDKLLRDALELLKEQEAVKPYISKKYGIAVCDKCKAILTITRQPFCHSCGVRLKWE